MIINLASRRPWKLTNPTYATLALFFQTVSHICFQIRLQSQQSDAHHMNAAAKIGLLGSLFPDHNLSGLGKSGYIILRNLALQSVVSSK